jgi:PIN domain nuclease of toxin-antitoxin system
VILLDTNAVLFLSAGHRRARPLSRQPGRLYFTPFALLEMQFLAEAGRGSFTSAVPLDAVKRDPRWSVDDPPVDGVIERALALAWTRDPFDRLIVAHAQYRGWRLATSDAAIMRNLPRGSTFPL